MLSTLVAAALLAAAPPVSSAYPTQADYLRILQRFPRYAERGWHVDQRGPGLGWFGDGRSDENGQRTLANFVLTYAWLATRPDYDPTPSGVSQAVIRDHALASLRYRLRTHVTGDLTCSDGKPWGDHWQSAWWVSRMLGGADLLRPFLTADDQQRLEAMVVHEADRHIGLPPRVGEYGDTKSEENAWDSEVLAWALCLYPDDPDAAAWREAFNRLCLNTLAVEADLTSAKEVDGRPLSEWVGGASVHPDYTIENHGYFHICYMICPQHSFAWDYYVFRRFGQQPPAAIYHHTRDVWRRTKQFFLWDNRFAYVGGKDWPRYAYGMYFVLPALVHYQHAFGDRDARLIEQRRVAAFEQEQLHWNDGSFFSGRFTRGLMERWPSEWETDCAANLTIAALLHGTRAPLAPTPAADLAKRNEGTFLSPYSQLAMRRDPQRFAAWAWKSHAGPVSGMVCSDRGEHLLEWDRSLAGSLDLAGAAPRVAVESQRDVATPGGFRSEGIIGHGLVAAEPSPYRLTVVDDNVRTQTIRVPSHPIFTTPHRVESVAGLTDLDSVTAAGTGWTALATNTRGGPSLLEAKVGQGTFLLSMTNVEQRLTEGDATATALLQNIMAYLGAAKGRCAYLAGESWLANALDRLDVTFTTVRPSWRLDLQGYDVLFIDRSAATAIPVYPAILDFVRRGGRVFSSIIQDTGWLPDAIATIPPVAVRQHVLFTPLDDGRTVVLMGRWRASRPVAVRRLDLLRWQVANDLFNGGRRQILSADIQQPSLALWGPAGSDALHRLTGWLDIGQAPAQWLNLDDDLGLVVRPAVPLWVKDNQARTASQRSLCLATISAVPDDAARSYAAGEEIARLAAVFRTRVTAAETAALAAKLPPLQAAERELRLRVPGADGQVYDVRLDTTTKP